MATPRTVDFKAPLCRLSYAKGLFVAERYQGDPNAALKFTPSFIWPNKDKAFFEPYILEVLKQMDKGVERFKSEVIVNPLYRGDGKEAKFKDGDNAGEIKPGLGKDVFFIRATAQPDNPPAVWFIEKDVHGKPKQVDETVAYSGCYGRPVLNVFAWKSGKGISIGISGFQKLQEGEPLFSGGKGSFSTDKWNETIADEGPAPEVTKGGGGAGGLFGD